MNHVASQCLYKDDDLRVDFFAARENSNRIVVFTFVAWTPHSNNPKLDHTGFGGEFLLKNGFDVIAFKSAKNHWYQNVTPDIFETIETFIASMPGKYSIRAGYGASMGASAVIQFSKYLQLDRALAISPLFDIREDWDKRWTLEASQINNYRYPMTEAVIRAECDYFIVYDPFFIDKLHVEKFKNIIPSESLSLYPLSYTGHSSIFFLLEIGELQAFALNVISNGVLPPLPSREAKRKSKTYFHNFANYCSIRRKNKFALMLVDKALDLDSNNAAFHSMKGLILSNMGRLDEAIESTSRGIELDPNNPYLKNLMSRLVLTRNDDVYEALEWIDQAIILRPNPGFIAFRETLLDRIAKIFNESKAGIEETRDLSLLGPAPVATCNMGKAGLREDFEVHEGICPICGPTAFVIEGPALRDQYVCSRCHSIPRFRALIHVLDTKFPNWRELKIHESSPRGAASQKLMTECMDYSFSQYLPEVPGGEILRGVRCEDIEHLTFPNNSFDLFITQDVMEHIFDARAAFREIQRVLRPGGAYVFTAPCYRRDQTVVRARRGLDGEVFDILPPIYHVNPIDAKGSLVVREWTPDIVEFIREATGVRPEMISLNDRTYGLDGPHLDVFICPKAAPHEDIAGDIASKECKDPVIVYNMGKVGSRSVYETLEDLLPDVKLYHAHVLDDFDNVTESLKKRLVDSTNAMAVIRQGMALRRIIGEDASQRWRLISLIRDPVGRNVSHFFQGIEGAIPDIRKRLDASVVSIDELIRYFFEKWDHTSALKWFDNQFKTVFGIDVYDRPFPLDRGYDIFHEGRFSLLVIRMEDLDRVGGRALEEFLGLDGITLKKKNIGGEKWYSGLYREFMSKLSPADEYLEEQYNSKFARHFYSPQEIEGFRARWRKNATRAVRMTDDNKAGKGITMNDKHIETLRAIEALPSLSKATEGMSVKQLLASASDEFYFWLLTDGQSEIQSESLRARLPVMPDERTQTTFTGKSGKTTLEQSFAAFKLFKHIAADLGVDIGAGRKVLDFGCGWGRIIRFFQKDVGPADLFGIDVNTDVIGICKRSNIGANFEAINVMPPTRFSDNTFDVIYLYSVFSHLSEEATMGWVREFHRMLRPGGVLIATTRPRSFIVYCDYLRKLAEDNRAWSHGAAAAFTDLEQTLLDYDSGKFCFSPGSSRVIEKSVYGEAAIPRGYVEEQWTKYFPVVEFIYENEHRSFDQNVIVAQKEKTVSLHDPIIVYNMGKVGSRSVFETLKELLPEETPLYHAHVLHDLDRVSEGVKKHLANPVDSLTVIHEGMELRRKIDENPGQHWTLISLVRDPIGRNVSRFFQGIAEVIPDIRKRVEEQSITAQELVETFKTKWEHSSSLLWFDNQFKPVFDIDIYERPFPWDKGYDIFHKGRFSVLVVRMEDLDRCASLALEEFFGLKGITLMKKNIGSDKWYKELYREFMSELNLPDKYLDEQYTSKFAAHFYSPAELDSFRARWKRKETVTMPSIAGNKKCWTDYSWENRGDEWSAAWGGTINLWQATISTRIQEFVPTGHILEIAPGFGRCTQFLLMLCKELTVVDLTERCISACKERFKAHSNINYFVNDGKSLAMLADNSVDFAFSWDSLVHVESDVMASYVKELARVLKPGGFGFLHHSNFGAFVDPVTKACKIENTFSRGVSMTAELFREYCRTSGLKCVSQEIIGWGRKDLVDCLSLFTKDDSYDKETVISENPDFMQEAVRMKKIHDMYSRPKKVAPQNEVIKQLEEMVKAGETLATEGMADEAMQYFEGMLRSIGSVRGTILNNLAVIHAGRGRLDEAELLLIEAVRENNPEAQRNLDAIREMRTQGGQ